MHALNAAYDTSVLHVSQCKPLISGLKAFSATETTLAH